MSDLLEKLEAAIAETERIARDACDGDSGVWFVGRKWGVCRADIVDPHDEMEEHQLVASCDVKAQSEHIERNDPARVLRRVARDREVLARHRPESIRLPGDPAPRLRCFWCRADGPFLADTDASVGGAARARYDRLSIPAPWPCDDVRDLAEDYEIEVES